MVDIWTGAHAAGSLHVSGRGFCSEKWKRGSGRDPRSTELARAQGRDLPVLVCAGNTMQKGLRRSGWGLWGHLHVSWHMRALWF